MPKRQPHKVLKNFKMTPQMVLRLKKESDRTGRTQTKIVEMALNELFSRKAA